MSREAMTLEQIRRTGLEALANALGTVGMVRFLQQFETGSGDYTRERQERPPAEDVAALAAKIRAHRQIKKDS